MELGAPSHSGVIATNSGGLVTSVVMSWIGGTALALLILLTGILIKGAG